MISVIVPVYNESDNIDKFIDRLDVFDDEFEVIFSVSGDDDTFEKIKKRGYNPIKSIKGRGNQIINGILNSNGEIILILHADTFFRENPKEEIKSILENYKMGCFSISFVPKKFIMQIVAFNSSNRVRHRNIAFGDQGMFFTRGVYDEMGGLKNIDLMEDYDFSIRVKEKGYTIFLSKMKIYSSSRRFQENGPFRTMWMMQKCQHMYRKGEKVDDIKQKYK